jgi:hypothetical protein
MLREGNAKQTKIGGFMQHLERNPLFFVDLAGDRGDLLVGELADGLSQQSEIFGKFILHRVVSLLPVPFFHYNTLQHGDACASAPSAFAHTAIFRVQ